MATAIWLSASLVLQTTRKRKFTFPIFAVGAVLTNLLTIILDIAIPVTGVSIWFLGGHLYAVGLTCRPDYENGHLGLDARNHDPGDCPYEGRNHHHGCDEGKDFDLLCGESVDRLEHVLAHGRNRSAKTLKGEFWPTSGSQKSWQ